MNANGNSVNTAAENVVPFVRQRARRPVTSECARAEVISMVVHDFRQPLNTISLFASALSRADAASGGKLADEIEPIRRAVKTLARMTADLLDVSMLEARGVTLERVPVHIAALVTEAVASVPELAQRCEIRVRRDAHVVVRADPGRIVQVLANLLANAVKYGDAETPIVIDVTRTRHEARIAVANRGPGILSSELPFVFERFYRGDRVRARRPGLGLGLAIVKAIVEAHGGRVYADSVQDELTRFAFSLPLGAAR